MHTWLLPEYIEDVLPAEAQRIETTRRRLLDLFRLHGYQLVMPPLLEYVESLLTGTGHEMDIKTFKLVDQLSGRLMGLRADITPQVARIDAHLLNRQGVTRLCYAGSVLHTLPAGVTRTREPLQIGAEEFCKDFSLRRARVKALLLDQRVLRGVGNIYADESLFRARLHPARISASLKKKQLLALRGALREILEAAIRFRGSSISDYVDAEGKRGGFQQRHRVYQRGGKPCFRCGKKIRRVIVAGRSSYFCPGCQPAPRSRKK